MVILEVAELEGPRLHMLGLPYTLLTVAGLLVVIGLLQPSRLG